MVNSLWGFLLDWESLIPGMLGKGLKYFHIMCQE